MSEMIERVEKAIRDKAIERGYSINPLVRHLAVAAIEAMREPTVEMVVAAYTVVGVPRKPVLANGYRAMIDEALK